MIHTLYIWYLINVIGKLRIQVHSKSCIPIPFSIKFVKPRPRDELFCSVTNKGTFRGYIAIDMEPLIFHVQVVLFRGI